jgi:transaldolase
LTINAMLDETIRALADHGRLGPLLSAAGDQSSATLSEFARAGVDLATFGAKLQTEAVNRVAACWNDLLITIASKAASPNKAG